MVNSHIKEKNAWKSQLFCQENAIALMRVSPKAIVLTTKSRPDAKKTYASIRGFVDNSLREKPHKCYRHARTCKTNMCNTTCARNLKASDSSFSSGYDLFCVVDEQAPVRTVLQNFPELNSYCARVRFS